MKTKKQLPKVSIITVNYKQPQVTCELLKSINKLQYSNLEVILVDNESLGHCARYYQKFYQKVIVINSITNRGYAGANNLGILQATGEYIFLLNNDTEITEGIIESLLSKFSKPDIAAVSPVIRYYDTPDKIQFAGFTPINTFTGRNRMLRQMPSKDSLEDNSISTPYFHGAAVMLRANAIVSVGLMPEEYFLYYEELDWSVRFAKAGWKIKVDLDANILHKESISTGKNSVLKTYYQTRNRLLFMKRNFSGLSWVIFLQYFIIFSTISSLFYYLRHYQGDHIRAFLKGIIDFIVLPSCHKKVKYNQLSLHSIW